MSILIKGMDKPTDCGVCPFEDFGYCNVKGERNTSEVGIDADCPLIEIAEQTEPSEVVSCSECCKWWFTDDGKDGYCQRKYHNLECKFEPQTEREGE